MQSLYSRTTADFLRGSFRVKGDVVDVFPGYADFAFRIHFFGDEIEEIEAFDVLTNQFQLKYMLFFYLSYYIHIHVNF